MNRMVFAIVLVLMPGSFLTAAEVTASVDARTVMVEQPFKLTIEARDTENMPVVRIPSIEGIAIISGPMQSSNYSWVNGKMSGYKSLSYTMIALSPGEIIIPAMDVRVDKKLYKTAPIAIQVVNRGQTGQSSSQASNPSVFIRALPSKDEVYLGEPLHVKFKLYTQVNVYNYQIEKYPDAVGFWSEGIEEDRQPRLVSEILNGVRYNTAILKTVVFYPTRSGDLEIDPLIAQLELEVKGSSSSRRSLFNDPFFNDPLLDPFGRRIQRNFSTETLRIRVKPLPEPTPADFNGAVGYFTLNAKLDTSVLQVNDAVGLHITLQGRGNFKTLKIPEPDLPETIDAFKPERSESIRLQNNQYIGMKQATYLLVPRTTGDIEINPISFSYFDPDRGRYERATTRELQLHIVQAGKGDHIIVSGYSREEVELMGQDIKFIKAPSTRYTPQEGGQERMAILWISIILGGMAVGGFFYWEIRTDALNANIALKRRNRALRRAKHNLNEAKHSLLKEDAFTATLHRTIVGYLGDRLNLSEQALETEALLESLKEHFVDDKIITDLGRFLELLARDRFAPEKQKLSQSDLVEATEKWLEVLSKEIPG